jgi:hypothetical protein
VKLHELGVAETAGTVVPLELGSSVEIVVVEADELELELAPHATRPRPHATHDASSKGRSFIERGVYRPGAGLDVLAPSHPYI